MSENKQLNEARLEAMVEAALAGHDLGPFEPVERGYQATCRRCGESVWLGDDGLIYSLLEDRCENRAQDN